MRSILLLLALLSSFNILIAQSPGDTTVVQTFTFGSKQDYWFQLPAATERYQKILMQYTLKCNPAQSPACGEWDYTTQTFLYDHLGIYDSTLKQQPSFVVDGASPDTFQYITSPSYIYIPRLETRINYTDTLSLNTATLGAGAASTTASLHSSQTDGEAFYLWRASELTNAGLTAGDITGLRLNVNVPGSFLNKLRVDFAPTTTDTLTANTPLPNSYTTVYQFSQALATGWNSLAFVAPFTWDGSSNVLVRFSFDNSTNGTDYTLAADNTGFASSKEATGDDKVIDFEGADYIEVPAAVFNTVDSQISISFWQYGDAALQPQNDIVFEGINADGSRVLNAHLPWGDGKVYWDAGAAGALYDRASKAASTTQYKGNWNHWVFSKDVATGYMRIYLNGNIWLSFNNKTALMDGIVKFRIGSGANGGSNYDGLINEFQIWDTVLDVNTVREWMYKDVDASHPYYQNLRAYYKFDEGSGLVATDASPNGFDGQMWGAPRWSTLFDNEGYRNYQYNSVRPQVVFEQGSFVQDTVTVVVVDTVEQAPLTVQTFTNAANPTNPTDTFFYWAPYYNSYVYDAFGNAIDSTLVPATGSLIKSTLPYYEQFEVVEHYEIGRFITPYGNGLDMGDGFTWTYDVTDYRPLLSDSVHLSAGNWQELLDLKFIFIHGTPARDVIKIENVWKGDYYLSNMDQTLLPKNVTLDPAAKSFRLKTRASGHHWDNPTNCAEFCPKVHQVYANGIQVSSWQNWKDCGQIPLFPQGGSWLFDRAGWCPGEPVDQYDHELTPYITDGSNSVDLLYTVETDDYGYNILHVQLVSYGEPNFGRDVELAGIVSPSNTDEYSRYNPVCNYPVVRIRNLGSETLTQADFTFGVDGGTDCYYTWTGNLKFLEEAEVTLPTFDWNGMDVSNPRFHVTVDYPNGRGDQNKYNNTASSAFELIPIYDSLFIMTTKTNAAGAATSYTITNESDSVVYAKDNFANSTTVNDTLRFGPGCYKLSFYDAQEDGLNFFLSNDGNGTVRFRNYANTGAIKTFEPNFGEKFTHQFMVGYGAGQYPLKDACTQPTRDTTTIGEVAGPKPYVTIYPNPTQGQILLRGLFFEPADITIDVYNMLGVLLHQQKVAAVTNLNEPLDISTQPAGTYLVVVRSAGHTFVHKLLKE